MHFSLIFDESKIVSGDPEVIKNRVVNLFADWEYISPIKNYYIIKVKTNQQYDNFISQLQSICEETKLRSIVSPTMTGGTYDGWFNKMTWERLNKISED